MRIKRAAALAIMNAIVERISTPLGQAPTILTSVPSQKADYPAIAILIDSSRDSIDNDDQDIEFDPTKSPGDEGYELTGFFRTDPVNNDYIVGTTYKLDQDTTISQIGTIQMKGRLWVGARLDPQRSQIEEEVKFAFYEDRAAPGRLQVSVAGVEINGVKIPFGVATAFFEDDTQWNSEFAFAERLWTYMKISIDVPILVPRYDPIATDIRLLITEDLNTPITEITANDVSQFSINPDGNVTQL